jgi:isopentenyl-diphosphate delta-isomerase
MNDYLILVDENDRQWGKLDKDLVHELGLLHRAFSVFIFNTKGELLLQQRADDKYHSAGLWTNTCCSHPRFDEKIEDAVSRRLMEEMRLSCETKFVFSFTYKVKFENGLTEYEYDHVYFGMTNQFPVPDKSEVKGWKYFSLQNLDADIHRYPENYSEWLKICLPEIHKHFPSFFENNRTGLDEHVSV